MHILMLLPLFEAYHLNVPDDYSKDHVVVPDTLQETFSTGIEAEKNNIAMYELFLQKELPDDVRDVFNHLKNASEHHLSAFN